MGPISVTQGIHTFIGVMLVGPQDDFWQLECPCGVKVTYPINGLPLTDTRFPCENENHWVVRVQPQESSQV